MASKTARTEKTGRVGQRRQVVIPREMLDTLNIRKGDLVGFTQNANGVLIKAKRPANDGTVLTPEEAQKVRKGLKQIRGGKTIPWLRLKHELDL